MRISRVCLVWTLAMAVPALAAAQAPAPKPSETPKPSEAEDKDRAVAGGGITAPGWAGKVDAKGTAAGLTVKDSKFEQKGDTLHLTIGPATSYWNPANTVKGDYTVKGTFTEPKQDFSHPHPMGLFIGGSKLGTPEQSLLYCVAYRSGNFLIRRFNGDQVTTLVPQDAARRGEEGRDARGSGDPGNSVGGEGRQGRLRHQRHERGVAAGGGPGRSGQAGVDRRRLGHPGQPQHGPDRFEAVGGEELR